MTENAEQGIPISTFSKALDKVSVLKPLLSCNCIHYGSFNWLVSRGHASLPKCMLACWCHIMDQFFLRHCQVGRAAHQPKYSVLAALLPASPPFEKRSSASQLDCSPLLLDRRGGIACKFITNAARIKSKRTTESKSRGGNFPQLELAGQAAGISHKFDFRVKS